MTHALPPADKDRPALVSSASINRELDPILVTGATGFIGSHLCRRLVAEGRHVIGVSRSQRSKMPKGVERRVVDLSDAVAVAALFDTDKPQTIFHLASHVVARRGVEEVMPSFNDTLSTTVNLLVAAQRHTKGKFILAGSLEEPTGPGVPPASPYAASKAAATSYARMFHSLYGLRVVIARIFMVYGPDQKDRKKLIPYVIDSLLAGESPRIGSPSRKVDWIHVSDVVEGLLSLVSTTGIAGKTIDLGSGELVPVKTLVERLASLVPSTGQLIYDTSLERAHEQVRQANVEDTTTTTGWAPGLTLEEGLLDTVNWHRETGPGGT